MVAHGPALILAVLVAMTLGYPLGAATAGLAFVAATIRWGSGWLVAIAGAQAVLGPAITVGPVAAASSSWLSAACLIIAVPDRSAVAAASVGVAAALVAAGPAGWDGAAVRLLAAVVAVAAAVAAGRIGHARLRAAGGLACAATAVVLAVAG